MEHLAGDYADATIDKSLGLDKRSVQDASARLADLTADVNLAKDQIRQARRGGDNASRSRESKRRSGLLASSVDARIAPSVAEQMAAAQEREKAAAEQAEEHQRQQSNLRKQMGLLSVDEGRAKSHLDRDTPLPQTAYLRFRVTEDNRQMADLGRAEHEALLLLKEEQASAWVEHGKERVQERVMRQKRCRKLQKSLMKQRGRTVRQVREAEDAHEKLLAARRAEFHAEMRKRVLEASALDAKLDASEEKVAASQREEGTRERAEVTAACSEARAQQLAKRRGMAERNYLMAKEIREQIPHLLASFARQRGQEKREEATKWSVDRTKREETYLDKAKANRERALATRERAKSAMAEVVATRKKAAAKERDNDHLVTDEKMRILEANKKEVSNIYKARFASREAATEYENSPWKELASSMWVDKESNSQTSALDLPKRHHIPNQFAPPPPHHFAPKDAPSARSGRHSSDSHRPSSEQMSVPLSASSSRGTGDGHPLAA